MEVGEAGGAGEEAPAPPAEAGAAAAESTVAAAQGGWVSRRRYGKYGKKEKRRRLEGGGEASGEAASGRQAPPAAATSTSAVKHNGEFEAFYRAQRVVPKAEWAAFMATLRRELPVVVRVNCHRHGWQERARAFAESPHWKALPWLQPPTPAPAPGLVWQCDAGVYAAHPAMRAWCGDNNKACTLRHQEAVSQLPGLALGIDATCRTVLDMCAAPGSKTMQLLELLEAAGARNAVVVANDSDPVKALGVLGSNVAKTQATNVAVTCWNAARFPTIASEADPSHATLFDRVLADVPCSGDGTIRKNPEVWGTWKSTYALKLHKTQRRILIRGLTLLAEGGRLVYSTCSLNPIENEAVVLSALAGYGDEAYLEEMSFGDGLQVSPGLTDWVVPGRPAGAGEAQQFYGSWDEVPETSRSPRGPILKTMFPTPQAGGAGAGGAGEKGAAAAEGDDARGRLRRCCRLLPQANDTGGFFIASIRKRRGRPVPMTVPAAGGRKGGPRPGAKAPAGNDAAAAVIPWHGRNKHHRFELLDRESEDWLTIVSFYGLDPDALAGLQLARQLNVQGRCRRLVVASAALVRLLRQPTSAKPRSVVGGGPLLAAMGVPIFKRLDDNYMARLPCRWRPATESARLLSRAMTKRKLTLPAADFAALLRDKRVGNARLAELGAAGLLPPFVLREGAHGSVLASTEGQAEHGVWVPCVLTGKALEFQGRARDIGNPVSTAFPPEAPARAVAAAPMAVAD